MSIPLLALWLANNFVSYSVTVSDYFCQTLRLQSSIAFVFDGIEDLLYFLSNFVNSFNLTSETLSGILILYEKHNHISKHGLEFKELVCERKSQLTTHQAGILTKCSQLVHSLVKRFNYIISLDVFVCLHWIV